MSKCSTFDVRDDETNRKSWRICQIVELSVVLSRAQKVATLFSHCVFTIETLSFALSCLCVSLTFHSLSCSFHIAERKAQERESKTHSRARSLHSRARKGNERDWDNVHKSESKQAHWTGKAGARYSEQIEREKRFQTFACGGGDDGDDQLTYWLTDWLTDSSECAPSRFQAE